MRLSEMDLRLTYEERLLIEHDTYASCTADAALRKFGWGRVNYLRETAAAIRFGNPVAADTVDILAQELEDYLRSQGLEPWEE